MFDGVHRRIVLGCTDFDFISFSDEKNEGVSLPKVVEHVIGNQSFRCPHLFTEQDCKETFLQIHPS